MATNPFADFGGDIISIPNSSQSNPFKKVGGGIITPPIPTTSVPAKNFYYEYMNSPIYKQRLKNAHLKSPPNIQNMLNTNIMNQNGFGSEFLTGDPQDWPRELNVKTGVPNINIDRDEIKQTKKILGATDRPDDVLAHEFSHQTRPLSNQEQMYILGKNKTDAGKYYLNQYSDSIKQGQFKGDIDSFLDAAEHDENPLENKADLDALRYMMWKNKIYDTSKRNMTLQDLNNAKNHPEIKKSMMFQRLMKRFKPEDIILLNNTIAANNPTITTQNYV